MAVAHVIGQFIPLIILLIISLTSNLNIEQNVCALAENQSIEIGLRLFRFWNSFNTAHMLSIECFMTVLSTLICLPWFLLNATLNDLWIWSNLHDVSMCDFLWGGNSFEVNRIFGSFRGFYEAFMVNDAVVDEHSCVHQHKQNSYGSNNFNQMVLAFDWT